MSLGMQEILPDGGLASFQNEVSKLADLGRYEDAYIVHAAEGETIVPMAVFDENPRLKAMLFAQMRGMGIDPQRYIVGNEFNSINPITGQPEFFLKKIFKEAKKAVKTIAPYAGVIAGAMGMGPIASAGIGALGGYYGEGDMGGALKGGLYGYTAGKGFGAGKDYVFGGERTGMDRFTGSLGRIGENFGMLPKGDPDEIKAAQALIDNAETAEQLEFAKKKLAMVQPGFLERMSGMDLPTKGLLGATAMYGLSDITGAGKDEDEGMPEWWDEDIYGPWWGASFAPAPIMKSANGGIIQNFDNGGEVDIKEIESLMEYTGMTYDEAKEYLDSIEDMNTGGIVQLAEGSGPRDVHPGTEQELTEQEKQFLARRIFLGETEQEGIMDQARKEFSARTEQEEIMSGAIMRVAKFLKPEGRLNTDVMTRAGKMLITMDPMQLARLVKTAGRINIDDIQQAEEMQMKMRESMDSTGTPRKEDYIAEQYTESKYADGGIAHLSAGAFPRMTGAISGPGGPKDDMVPAMLSDGEFVMTAEAVRNAGGGDRREGARRMYQLMNQLQQGAMV
jgi:hypothetical protein